MDGRSLHAVTMIDLSVPCFFVNIELGEGRERERERGKDRERDKKR